MDEGNKSASKILKKGKKAVKELCLLGSVRTESHADYLLSISMDEFDGGIAWNWELCVSVSI